jgi:signal transduction histidine kinase
MNSGSNEQRLLSGQPSSLAAQLRQTLNALRYHVRQFRLRIRDDGRGVDPQILASRGREGHFGLKGMHERAELAGGKLRVWSAGGAGTELEVTIPGTHAYAGTAKVGISL